MKKKSKIIPYSTQNINSSDIKSVLDTLQSGFLSQGPKTLEFEQEMAKLTNSKYAVSANSATSGLHLICLALGLNKKDIVWISSISFVATANCAAHCGSKIDFVDVNKDTFNICVENLEKKLKVAKLKKKLPKVLIVVHLGGLPSEMDKIFKLSKKFNFLIIEDASHALGSKYNNILIGSCKHSIATVFSFHPVKIATTAEGGVITTNSKKLNKNLRIFREHGIVRSKKYFKNKKNKFGLYYEQQNLGYNFKLSELHASLGLSQIKRLNYFTKTRNELRNKYIKELSSLPIRFQKIPKNYYSSFHLMIIRINKNLRNKLFEFLKKNNVKTNVHYLPIFLHPFYYQKKHDKNINSINYYNESLSIPLYVNLKKNDQIKVINLIKQFFKK